MEEPAASFGSSGSVSSSCIPAESTTGVPDIVITKNYDEGTEQEDEDMANSVPASPITVSTMQQLLKRPFAEVLKEITATLQVRVGAITEGKMVISAVHMQCTGPERQPSSCFRTQS